MQLEGEDVQRLLTKIHDQRARIDLFLRRARPRRTTLTVVTIVSSALAAALTAGPALGGKNFTETAAKALDLSAPTDVWQYSCLVAMLVSITAAICVNLNQVSKTDSKIVSAEVCRTELACLETLVEFHQVSLPEALKLYQQHITRVPFLEEPDEGWVLPPQVPGGRTSAAAAG
jgi:hypothetical protein